MHHISPGPPKYARNVAVIAAVIFGTGHVLRAKSFDAVAVFMLIMEAAVICEKSGAQQAEDGY
jgi:hypothetical protein